jgi:hypothetical protein
MCHLDVMEVIRTASDSVNNRGLRCSIKNIRVEINSLLNMLFNINLKNVIMVLIYSDRNVGMVKYMSRPDFRIFKDRS